MKDVLYLVVLILSFGPSIILLTIGVIFSPIWIYSLIDSKLATLIPLLLVIAGVLGFWGMVASLIVTVVASSMDWILAFAMSLPIPVTSYLTYRNRAYFHKSDCS